MPTTHEDSRRRFIKTVAAGAAAATTTPSIAAKSYDRIIGANDQIRVGVIGMGQQGRGLTRRLLAIEGDHKVVAFSDVYAKNLEYTSTLDPDADHIKDYREMLDRDDVDAVMIASPDHWHALQTIHACQAGKDVYVEKPVSVDIAEGRAMVKAARKYDRIVQVGTQQRSAPHFQEVARIIQSGEIGDVTFVRAWNYSNEAPDGFGNTGDSEPPPGLDWDLWLGPAQMRPFNENRFGAMQDENFKYRRWATFRYFWDYAGGMMTDWGVHHLDIVQMVMQEDYPKVISAVGGKWVLTDNRDTPDTLSVNYQFENFACVYENRAMNQFNLNESRNGFMFHGTNGTLYTDRGGWKITAEPDSGIEERSVDGQKGSHPLHITSWLETLRDRKTPICEMEVGHRSTTTAILGNIAYRMGRGIRWDGVAEEIIGDPEASAMLMRPYRDPYKLEV